MKYSMTAWAAALAVTGIVYAARSGPVSNGLFDAALIVIVALTFLRDSWRARYKNLAGRPPPPQRDLPGSVRLLPPEDETREWPRIPPDDGRPRRR